MLTTSLKPDVGTDVEDIVTSVNGKLCFLKLTGDCYRLKKTKTNKVINNK